MLAFSHFWFIWSRCIFKWVIVQVPELRSVLNMLKQFSCFVLQHIICYKIQAVKKCLQKLSRALTVLHQKQRPIQATHQSVFTGRLCCKLCVQVWGSDHDPLLLIAKIIKVFIKFISEDYLIDQNHVRINNLKAAVIQSRCSHGFDYRSIHLLESIHPLSIASNN